MTAADDDMEARVARVELALANEIHDASDRDTAMSERVEHVRATVTVAFTAVDRALRATQENTTTIDACTDEE